MSEMKNIRGINRFTAIDTLCKLIASLGIIDLVLSG